MISARTYLAALCFLFPAMVVIGCVDLVLPGEIIRFGRGVPESPIARWGFYFVACFLGTAVTWTISSRLPAKQ